MTAMVVYVCPESSSTKLYTVTSAFITVINPNTSYLADSVLIRSFEICAKLTQQLSRYLISDSSIWLCCRFGRPIASLVASLWMFCQSLGAMSCRETGGRRDTQIKQNHEEQKRCMTLSWESLCPAVWETFYELNKVWAQVCSVRVPRSAVWDSHSARVCPARVPCELTVLTDIENVLSNTMM